MELISIWLEEQPVDQVISFAMVRRGMARQRVDVQHACNQLAAKNFIRLEPGGPGRPINHKIVKRFRIGQNEEDEFESD